MAAREAENQRLRRVESAAAATLAELDQLISRADEAAEGTDASASRGAERW